MLTTGDGFPDVVVTGIAVTSPLAVDAEGTWRALLDGRSGVRALDASFVDEFDSPVRIGAPLRENFDQELNRIELRRLSYLQKMATVLGRRLWANAGSPDIDGKRLLVSLGIGLGPSTDLVLGYDDMRARGLRAVSPLHVQMYMPNAAAAAVGLERKARAGVTTTMLGDASGAGSIAQAWRHIVLGEADVAICGGVETTIGVVPIAAFSQMDDVLSANNDDPAGACRPFDKNRDGMVFGEGGALMLIETEKHARARNAHVLARLMGAAITSDGYDVTLPEPSGELAADAITRAIRLAGLVPADVDHVNAHAAGTPFGDLAEANAIRRAMGGNIPAVYAPKSALGHSMGAAGAVEAVLTVQALRDGIVPPTLNLEELDPRIDLDVVAGKAREGDYRYAITTSFGLGGHNVAVAFGAY